MSLKEHVGGIVEELSRYFDMEPFLEDEFYTKVSDDECVYLSRLNGRAAMELDVYRAGNGWKTRVDVYGLDRPRDASIVSLGLMPADDVFTFVDGAYRAL